MVKILELRSLLRTYYQKFQMAVDPLIKFVAALVTFLLINKAIGYNEKLEKTVVVLLVSLLCAFTPSSILVFLAMAFVILHIASASPFMAMFVALIFVVLYCFFLRFAPQYGYVVVAIPILSTLHMPYLVPILMGLVANPITMLPSACGVVVYYMLQIVKEHTVVSDSFALDDILPFYTEVFEALLACKDILIVSGVFAVVIIAVYIVRRQKMEYAAELAILAGAVVNVFGFLICDLRFGSAVTLGSMILGTLLSAVAAFVALFFKRVLDYTAVENVQFEDDDYYYYVKAVPKIEIGIAQRKVEHINEKDERTEEEEDEDDYEEVLDEETGEVIFRPRSGNRAGGQVRRQKGGKSSGYFYRKMQEEKQKIREEEQQRARAEMRAAKRYESGEEQYLGEDDLLRSEQKRFYQAPHEEGGEPGDE